MGACFLYVCHIHVVWTWISTRDRAPWDRPTWFFCLADWPALGPSCSPGPMWSRSGRWVLRGTARPQTLHCLALSSLPTHPSHTRHPVLQYLCCLCVCVCVCVSVCIYIYLFLQGDLRVCVFSVSPLVVDLCGHTRCSHKMIHSVFGNKQPKKMKRPTVVCLSCIWKFLKMIMTVFVVQSAQLVSGVGSQVASAKYR